MMEPVAFWKWLKIFKVTARGKKPTLMGQIKGSARLVLSLAFDLLFLTSKFVISCYWVNESCSVVSDSLWPHGPHSPWNSLGQNTGVGGLSIFQWIFLTQEPNQGLLHCRWILHRLSYERSPFLENTPTKTAIELICQHSLSKREEPIITVPHSESCI